MTHAATPILAFDPPRQDKPAPKGRVLVDLDRLVAGRMLVQATSGGGKSWLARYLLEQTHGRVQHLVVDPEGEFATLREKFAYVLAGGGEGDVPASPETAAPLCRKLLDLGASAILDLSDMRLAARRRFVRLFIEEFMALPRHLWRPILVVIDEAHRFAPERGQGESEALDAIVSLCSQGRKRAFSPVLLTQRLGKLNKDAAAELQNVFIGKTQLDIDVRRAGDALGFDKAQKSELAALDPGEFFAYGPALIRPEGTPRGGVLRSAAGP